uniref:Uncharacterized protein n=1 Tax=Glossina austeni TaxID=7395 RepID=A0A1A9VGE4_GLOAU
MVAGIAVEHKQPGGGAGLKKICPLVLSDKMIETDSEQDSATNNTNENECKQIHIWVNDCFLKDRSKSRIVKNALRRDQSEATINTTSSIPSMVLIKSQTDDSQPSQVATELTEREAIPERTLNWTICPQEKQHLSTHLISTSTCTSCFAFESKKLDVEHQKLQLEQKKFEWQQEKERTELTLKQKTLENLFQLKNLELSRLEKMEKAKLELDHKEQNLKFKMKKKPPKNEGRSKKQ